MEYLIKYPSSFKRQDITRSLLERPFGLPQHPAPTDAATERSPKTLKSEFAQVTQDLLMEDSAANRAAAARKLATLGEPSATPYLIAALSDSSLEVRLAAVESLGQLGDSAEMAHLGDLLARGNHSESEKRVIFEAIHSIAMRGGEVSATPPSAVSPSLTLEERLCREEAALKEATQDFEQRRAEAEKLHRAQDEKERLDALEANRRIAEKESQLRNEKEQKLLAEIEALRKAEAEQLKRIEEANATNRRRSAEEPSAPADNETRECASSRRAEEEEAQLAQLEAVRFAAESEVELRADEKQRLSTQIKTLSNVTNEQIDRIEEASARLTLLEEARLHAETMVYQRADREIRLEAEIEALRRTEAAQLERIKLAEAEVQRLTDEAARAAAAAEVRRNAEAEARQRAAAEALQQVEAEARRLAKEEEQRIERLETVCGKAQAAAQARAEKEWLLNSQLLSFGEAAAEQVKRIEKAEADLHEAGKTGRRPNAGERLRSAEARARQNAQEEEQAIAQLELIRGAAEKEAQQRSEKIQCLDNEIEALRKTEVEQLQRIEETETRLHEMETRAKRRREKEQELIAALEALRKLEAEQLNRIADAGSALARAEETQVFSVG